MEQHSMPINEFNALLNEWTGKNIKISKQEIEDDDETFMVLEKVTYSEDRRRLDDYEAMHALQLSGIGKVENGDHDLKPLPLSSYEIPLDDTTNNQFDGSRFTLKNDRGTYTIELDH